MAIWKTLFGQVARQAGRKAMEKAREPETQEKARAAAKQAGAQAKKTVEAYRREGNPSRAAGRALGGAFVKLKQGIDRGFDAPPRDWGSDDEDSGSKKG